MKQSSLFTAELRMYEMSTNLKSANKLRLPSRLAEVVWSLAQQNLRASEAAIRWSKKYCVYDSISSPGGEKSNTSGTEKKKVKPLHTAKKRFTHNLPDSSCSPRSDGPPVRLDAH